MLVVVVRLRMENKVERYTFLVYSSLWRGGLTPRPSSAMPKAAGLIFAYRIDILFDLQIFVFGVVVVVYVKSKQVPIYKRKNH